MLVDQAQIRLIHFRLPRRCGRSCRPAGRYRVCRPLRYGADPSGSRHATAATASCFAVFADFATSGARPSRNFWCTKINPIATMWIRKIIVSAREIFEPPSSASISAALAVAATRCLRFPVTALRRLKIPLVTGRRLTGRVWGFMAVSEVDGRDPGRRFRVVRIR